jgi:hypothetical protein
MTHLHQNASRRIAQRSYRLACKPALIGCLSIVILPGIIVAVAALAEFTPLFDGPPSSRWGTARPPKLDFDISHSELHLYVRIGNQASHFSAVRLGPLLMQKPVRVYYGVLPTVMLYGIGPVGAKPVLPSWNADRYWSVLGIDIPLYELILVTALPPLSVLAIRVRRHVISRRCPGFCPGCGYDIRASPDRCPECGATVTSSASPPIKGVT